MRPPFPATVGPQRLLAGVLLLALASPSASASSWTELPELPAFAGEALAPATLEGQPVLLQFWASWCRSCASLMDEVDALTSRFPGVRHIAVGIDDEIEPGQDYLERLALFARHPQRFVFDQQGAFKQRFGVVTVPTLIVVDAKGVEVHRHVGHISSNELRALRTHLSNVSPAEVVNR